MNTQLEELERILGGKIEQRDQREIPGLSPVDGTEFLYFEDDRKNKFRKQFKNITCFTEPPNAGSGGVTESGCKITPPSGPLFHAISYHGDLYGWKKDIEAGANGLSLLLARIEGDQFVVSDG